MTETRNIDAALARVAISWQELKTLVNSVYGDKTLNKTEPTNLLKTKNGQNDKKEHNIVVAGHRHCNLEILAVKPSTQPTSRRLWLSPW